MRRLLKCAILSLCGGTAYYFLEVIWRGYSHWTMALLGGICFVLIGGLNNWLPWNMPLIVQGVAGSAVVTTLEFVFGCVLNIWLELDIWNYSNLPFNLLGQICLPYSLLWIVLSVGAVIADDWLRHWLFGEQKPNYEVF